MWVSIGQHVHHMQKTLKLFSLLFESYVHKNGSKPAQVCASVLLFSTVAKCVYSYHHHAVLPCTLINMHNEAARILNVCPKCICECCIWKINQQEDNSPLHAREWAVLPSHAEPCVALWHLILELLNCALACYISMDCEERGI